MKFLLKKESTDEVVVFAGRMALLVAVWFVLVCWLAFTGRFERRPDQLPIAVVAAFAIPIVVFVVFHQVSCEFRKFVVAIDLPLATAFQAWRFGGLGFLGLYAHGILPGFFAWPAGIGDIAVGVTAPWLAFRLERDHAFSTSRVLAAWNVFGLLDFVVAMTTGVVCSGIAVGTFGPITTAPMSQLPLVFIPAFFVPLYSMVHLIGLFQAWNQGH